MWRRRRLAYDCVHVQAEFNVGDVISKGSFGTVFKAIRKSALLGIDDCPHQCQHQLGTRWEHLALQIHHMSRAKMAQVMGVCLR